MLVSKGQAGESTDEERAAFALAKSRVAQLIVAIGDGIGDYRASGIVDEIIRIFEESGSVIFPEPF